MIASSLRSGDCTFLEVPSRLRSNSDIYSQHLKSPKEKSVRFLFKWLPWLQLRYVVVFICLAMYCAHSYSQVVCNTSRVVHQRTTGHGILSQRISGCIQRPCQHIEAHSGEPRRSIPSDDGGHLYAGEVSITAPFICMRKRILF